MTDFQSDRTGTSGTPRDYVPVTFSDTADLSGVRSCIGLRCQDAGDVAVQMSGRETRVLTVTAGEILPGAFTRVLATGTTVAAGSVFALAGE